MFFCGYREKHTMFPVPTLDLVLVPALVLVPDPTLIPAPNIAQKCKASWRLWYWRPVMDKSVTWVFIYHHPLQLLSSIQLNFSCPKRAIIGFLRFVSYGRIYCNLPKLEVVRPSYGRLPRL
jgi:hypothetical protein